MAVVLAVIAVAGCGGGSKKHSTTTSLAQTHASATATAGQATGLSQSAPGVWSTPNNGLENHREVSSQISSQNVTRLGVAWTVAFPPVSTAGSLVAAGQFSDYANTPIVGPNGVAYFQDIGYNVFAVNIKTGKVAWRHNYNQPSEGPNGLTLIHGVVYGTTPRYAFAINATTGEQLWRSRQLIATAAQARAAVKNYPAGTKALKGLAVEGQGINEPPQVSDGRVYISTSGQAIGGVAYALSAKTGKVLWSLNETKNPADRALGANSGTGGAWGAPAISPDGKTIYFGIANPYLAPAQAIKHPVRLLYNDSTIAVDAKTGKVKWYYQAVPDDFYDWDMQLSPIYVRGGNKGRDVVLDGGKMGYIYAMDAETGRLLWKTPVGKHNGHDNDSRLALEHRFHPAKSSYTVLPGSLGGIETNMAEAGGVVYAAANNMSEGVAIGKSFGQGGGGQTLSEASGDVAAVDVATGKKLWDTHLPHPPEGAATVSNDLVFTTMLGGRVLALSRKTGAIVWQGQLPTGTNSPVVIDGDTLVAVAGQPQGAGAKPQVVAFKLGAQSSAASHSAINGSPSPARSSSPTQAASGTASSVAAGRALFSQNCATCHTLAAAASHGTVGPNLDQLKPSMKLVEHQVTNGGGGMPAFGSRLKQQQIKSVAKFVSSVAGKPLTAKEKKANKGSAGGGP